MSDPAFIINIITLFPEFFSSPLQASLLGKALEKNIVQINFIQLRDFAVNKHGQIDDAPYGGGSGMVLMVEPIQKALESIPEDTHVVLLTPRGKSWNQKTCKTMVQKLSPEKKSLTLVCGHYEGIDERVVHFVDECIRVGDFVLSGGEPGALILVDSITRLLPGYMGNADSIIDESFKTPDYFEYPQYTRPSDYSGQKVPDILLSGDHAKISKWRAEQAQQASRQFKSDDETSDL